MSESMEGLAETFRRARPGDVVAFSLPTDLAPKVGYRVTTAIIPPGWNWTPDDYDRWEVIQVEPDQNDTSRVAVAVQLRSP